MKLPNAKPVLPQSKKKPGKAPGTKIAVTPPGPVFMKTVRMRPGTGPGAPSAKPQKRENTFSKSRDTREDRGARKMKTAHNPQTFLHGR